MSTNLEMGIVGLPNVGKSTLFNAITRAGAQAANYPFCTIEPNVGVVPVPDVRLDKLAALYQPRKVTPTSMRFVDIAGLVQGASRGEGLGNKFLAHIREVDAVAQVVRCFRAADVTHVAGEIDPLRDVEIINTELCLADLETVEKRQERAGRALKGGADKRARAEAALLEKLHAALGEGRPVRLLAWDEEETALLRELNLLTAKPVLYVANVGEDDAAAPGDNSLVQELAAHARQENASLIAVCAQLEAELAQLPPEEAADFLAELGLTETGLAKLIRASYQLLGLVTFFTAGEPEVRAWTIRRDTKAPQAAGKIHTDIERGFIRAEVVSYADLMAVGSHNAAREKGLVRLEGKDYVMQDGDVVYFRFNV